MDRWVWRRSHGHPDGPRNLLTMEIRRSNFIGRLILKHDSRLEVRAHEGYHNACMRGSLIRILTCVSIMVCAVPGIRAEVKLPPGVKLPPQPREWMAPRTDLTPPPPNAPWTEKWLQGRSLPMPVAGHSVVCDGRNIVLIGGITGREALGLRDVWVSRPGRDGELVPWKRMRPIPTPVAFGAAVLASGRIYLIGGSSREAIQHLYSSVYSAPLKRNGKVGRWREERAIPEPLRYHAAAVCSDRIYVLGGFNGSEYRDALRYADINSDGSLGEWKTASAVYRHPVGRTFMACVGDSLLVMGGLWTDSQGEHITSLVKRGTPGPDGDVEKWVDEDSIKIASRPLRFSLAEHAGVQGRNFLYIVAGRDPDSLGLATAQASWVNPRSGKITRWQFGPSIPLYGRKGAPRNVRLYSSQAAIAEGNLYVLGGFQYVREMTSDVWRMPLAEYRPPSWLQSAK